MKRDKPKQAEHFEPPLNAIQRAVVEFVQAHGGTVAVIGAVEIQSGELDFPGNFYIAVKCTGRKPTLAKETNAHS